MTQSATIPVKIEKAQPRAGFFGRMLDKTILALNSIDYRFESYPSYVPPMAHIARRRLENGEFFDGSQEIKYAKRIRDGLFRERRKFIFWHSEEYEEIGYRKSMFVVPFEIMRKVELSKEAQRVFLEIYKEEHGLFRLPEDVIKTLSECNINEPEFIKTLVGDLLAAEKRGDTTTEWTQWDGNFFDAEGYYYEKERDWSGIAFGILNCKTPFDGESQLKLVEMLVKHETAKGAGEKAKVLLGREGLCQEARELLKQAVSKAMLNVAWVRFKGNCEGSASN